MKTYVNLLVFIICFASSAWAVPPHQIKGRIVDAETRKPVDFADVLLFTPGNETPVTHTLPEADGTFEINGLKQGTYNLLIRLVGYDVYTKTDISVTSVAVDLGIIPMKQLEVGLGEVEVVAHKKQVIYKLDKRVIEASANLLSAGGTAVDILENTPSIRVNAEGDVSFRGSSGFIVYVDGKPSVFSGTQALKQIPAGQIQNIEIITTPSAQHDTQGDVGIINIITKKEYDQGLSGFVNVNGNTILSRGIDLLLTKQNKGSRWYVGGFAVNDLRESDFTQEKTTVVNDTTTVSSSRGPRKSTWYMYSVKGGWGFSTPKTTYSIDLETGYGGLKRKGDLNYTEQRSAQGHEFENGNFKSVDDFDIHETYGQGSVSANHKFNEKGHTLDGLFYLKYGGDALEYFQSDLYDLNNNRQQGHRAWESEHRWTVRGNLNYVLPYRSTGQLKAGYQYFSYLEDGDYKMQFWNPEKKEFYWRDDIYNTFYFQQGINSVYAIVSDSYKAFDFQVGVRGEHTRQELRSSKGWANRLYKRFEFFPSVHTGWNFAKQHKLLFSYSRRTNRPELYFMEPYITYRDYYTAEIGNPDIRPEYINSFELNYSYSSESNSFSASVFHRNRKDKIERLRVPYVAGVTLDSMANVGHDYSTGVEVSAVVQVYRWWNAQLNGSLYHYKVKNEYSIDGNKQTSTNYEISLLNNFDLGKDTRIQFDGNFVGPSVTTQGRTESFWYLNLAVRQQLFKHKVAATLSFRDLLNTARYNSNITTSGLYSYTTIKPKYPLISLTLSYTFNQFKMRNNENRRSHNLFEGTNH